MTHDEYKNFAETVERHGGKVVTFAEFPTTAQRDAAREELRTNGINAADDNKSFLA